MSQCLFFFFFVPVSFESPSLMGFMSFSLFIEHFGPCRGTQCGQTRHILIGRRQMVNGIVVDATWGVNWITRQCHWEGDRRGIFR